MIRIKALLKQTKIQVAIAYVSIGTSPGLKRKRRTIIQTGPFLTQAIQFTEVNQLKTYRVKYPVTPLGYLFLTGWIVIHLHYLHTNNISKVNMTLQLVIKVPGVRTAQPHKQL